MKKQFSGLLHEIGFLDSADPKAPAANRNSGTLVFLFFKFLFFFLIFVLCLTFCRKFKACKSRFMRGFVSKCCQYTASSIV